MNARSSDTTAMATPIVLIRREVSCASVTMDTEEPGPIALVRSQCYFVRWMFITVVSTSDINECAEGIDNCHEESNSACTDTDGSFTCNCSEGFEGNGTFCRGQFVVCVCVQWNLLMGIGDLSLGCIVPVKTT